MKNIFSFLSYHNAVPAGLIVLALGTGSAFAASQGVLPLPLAAPAPSVDISTPEGVDASALLAANLDTFDFRPTVTGVVETDALYTVSYSIGTLAPEGSEWAASSKTGEFSVAQNALGDGGLNAYVVGKLHDIENGERSYLSRAQSAEKALAEARQARPASAFAALVGLALDQIPVPVVEKPAAPESVPQPQTPPAQEAAPKQTPQPTTADSASADAAATSGSVATSTSSAASTSDSVRQMASSTIAAIGDASRVAATSTTASDTATTTHATSTTTPASDVTPTTSGSNATATSTTPVEQKPASTGQADTASTTVSSQ